jgi:hypothetical protein
MNNQFETGVTGVTELTPDQIRAIINAVEATLVIDVPVYQLIDLRMALDELKKTYKEITE